MSVPVGYVALYELQQYLVSAQTGQANANGILNAFVDSDRTVRKPIYELVASGPGYAFVELPNPLDLSSVGTPIDADGNDINIWVYPYNAITKEVELYYITVTSSVDEGEVLQFERQAVPSGVADLVPPTPTTTENLNNLIVNGNHYFNVGATGTISSNASTVLAPGGSSNGTITIIEPDIRLIKSVVVATDNIEFIDFALGDQPVANVFTPKQYLRYTCSSIPTLETKKAVQYVIGGVNELNNTDITFSICARSSDLNSLSIFAYQNFGTGGSPSVIPATLLGTIQLTADFALYTITATIPATDGLTLGTNGDDYLAIWVGFELNTLNVTDYYNVQVLLGNQTGVPFVYEQPSIVGGQVFFPRTGDIKVGYRNQDPGWLPMNDGSIGNASSNATTRAYKDTWPLFYYIWNNISDIWAPLYDDNYVPTARGVSASADFNANRQLSLPKQLGRVLAGINPPNLGIFEQEFTVSGNNLVVASTANYFLGQQVILFTDGTLPSPLAINTIYYVIPIDSTNIQLAADLNNAFLGGELTLSGGSGTHTVSLYQGAGIFNRVVTSVDPATDKLTLPDTSELFNGTPVYVIPGTGGVLPTPLVAGVPYFVTQNTTNTILLSETAADVFSDPPVVVDITTTGTSPFFIVTINPAFTLGQTAGESAHTMINEEIARHSHSYSRIGSGATGFSTGTTAKLTADDTGIDGLNEPFNITQPTTYTNVYIKL